MERIWGWCYTCTGHQQGAYLGVRAVLCRNINLCYGCVRPNHAYLICLTCFAGAPVSCVPLRALGAHLAWEHNLRGGVQLGLFGSCCVSQLQ